MFYPWKENLKNLSHIFFSDQCIYNDLFNIIRWAQIANFPVSQYEVNQFHRKAIFCKITINCKIEYLNRFSSDLSHSKSAYLFNQIYLIICQTSEY